MPGPDPILSTDVAGIRMRTPILLAAGTAGTLDEMRDVLDLSRVGGVVTKSITAQPREGNPTWRIVEHRAGMLNAIGLANVGLDHFAEHVAPRAAAVPTVIVASIAGFSIDEFVRAAAVFDEFEAIPAVELNVSCPNVNAGTEFAHDPRALRELVAAVRPVLTRTRLFVKLAPTIGSPSIADVARAAVEGDPRAAPAGPNHRPGADALTICNTIPGMAIDVRTRRPRLANVTGGFSGPGLHPVALKLVHDAFRAVARETGTPIIGAGGVFTWRDAAEFILAGASAVQVGSALFADPRAPVRIAAGLARWARRQGCSRVADLVGDLVLD